MKQKFSKNWISSKQPRKQVKYSANAPQHIKRKFLAANVTKSLREKYGRSLVIRKGDEVKVMRGKFKGKSGKVSVVDVKRTRIQISGVQRTKGSEKLETWFHPSKVMVISPDTSDSRRFKKKKTEEKDAHKKK
ncbi:50S ribosomal protein L24 [Candidatus Pacearchaeota archaeon]|nr:MAG: 50S ribosomal protein L24 [Candidatus Pacearchaeota archaeon]